MIGLAPSYLPEYMTGIAEMMPRLEPMREQSLVLIVGATGAGKSSLMNALMGHEFKQVATAQGDDVLEVVTPGPAVAMGNAVESCTLYPEGFFDASFGGYFCDCPGFLDTRPDKRAIVEGNLSLLVKQASIIKGLCIVIDHDLLYQEKGQNFKRLLWALNDAFPCLSDTKLNVKSESLAASMMIVFNPKGVSKTAVQLETKLQDLLAPLRTKIADLTLKVAAGDKSEALKAAIDVAEKELALMLLMSQILALQRLVIFNPDKPATVKAQVLELARSSKARAFDTSTSSSQRLLNEYLLQMCVRGEGFTSDLLKETITKYIKLIFGAGRFDDELSKYKASLCVVPDKAMPAIVENPFRAAKDPSVSHGALASVPSTMVMVDNPFLANAKNPSQAATSSPARAAPNNDDDCCCCCCCCCFS